MRPLLTTEKRAGPPADVLAARAAPAVESARQRRWHVSFPLAIAAAEWAAVALALTVIARLSYGSATTVHLGDFGASTYLAGLVGAAAWSLTLAAHGAYAHSVVGAGQDEPRRVLRAGVAFLSLIAVVDLVWTTSLAGRQVVVVVVVITLLTLAVRLAGVAIVRRARGDHRWMRRAVVYGGRSEAGALATLMAGAPHLGVDVVGTYSVDPGPHGAGPSNGNGRHPPSNDHAEDKVLRVLAATGADMLAIAAGTPSRHLRSLAWRLEGTGVELLVAPAVTDVARHAVAVRPVGDLPLLRVVGCRLAHGRLLVKNAIDRVGSVLLLVLLSPVMLAAALAVKLTSPARCSTARAGSASTGTRSHSSSSARWCATPTGCSAAWRAATRRTASCSRSTTTRG